jgi:hypothetical protein
MMQCKLLEYLNNPILSKHKYYLKIGKGKNARYFYSKEEYQAYAKKKYGIPEQKPDPNSTWVSAKAAPTYDDLTPEQKRILQEGVDKAWKEQNPTMGDRINDAKKDISKFMDKIKGTPEGQSLDEKRKQVTRAIEDNPNAQKLQNVKKNVSRKIEDSQQKPDLKKQISRKIEDNSTLNSIKRTAQDKINSGKKAINNWLKKFK